MKKFSKFMAIAFASALVFGMSSCDNVNMFDQMVTPSTIDVPASVEVSSIRIAVTAGHDWYVQSTADWITVNETSISATGFTINLEPYGPYGEETRTGIVLVSSQIGQWPVIVNQARRDFIFEDYLGTWTITADVRNIWGSTGMTYLEETVRMVDARDETPNSMYFWTIMSYDDNYSMDFTFDAGTGGLSFLSYDAGWFETRFAYFDGAGYVALPAGEPSVKLDPLTGKLTIPATVNVGGTDYPVHFYAYSGAFGMDWSYDSIYNIEFTKQDLTPGVPLAPSKVNVRTEVDQKVIDRKMK